MIRSRSRKRLGCFDEVATGSISIVCAHAVSGTSVFRTWMFPVAFTNKKTGILNGFISPEPKAQQ